MQYSATQQCNGKTCEKCPRGKVQRNATQQSDTKDIFKLKPKCNAMQHNSAMGRYVRNALEEKVQCNTMQQSNTKDILKLKPKCNTTQQCNGKICEKCPRGKVQCNTMQHNATERY